MNTKTDVNEGSAALHCYRDTCPECGEAKLEFYPGSEYPRDCFAFCACPNCKAKFDVDFERQAKRELAMNIASDLFTSGQGHHVPRLVLMMDNGRDVGGWCQLAVEDRIFAALSR